MADEGRRGRLLLRVLERRALATVPHRTHPADFPRFGLAELSGCKPQICRRADSGNGWSGSPARFGTGLSFCTVAANDQAGASRRARCDFLAYPLAQPGSLWNLPLAARAAGRIAGSG